NRAVTKLYKLPSLSRFAIPTSPTVSVRSHKWIAVTDMTRLLAFSLTALMLAAAGCNKESTELPVDGRDFDGVGYSTTAVYSGRVIDGYLREARVWLDVDGNGQYTPGPLTLTLDSGINIVLEEGEPTAMSGAGGQFRLDISGLARDAGEAP